MNYIRSLGAALISPILPIIRLINPTSAILFMHGVTKGDPISDVFNLHIRQDVFEAICRYLKVNYEVIDIDELADIIMTTRKVPRRTVVLTFDDGYRNNLLNVLPVLQAFNLPASVYISTRHISECTIPLALKIRIGITHTHLKRITLYSLNITINLEGGAQRQSAIGYLLHLTHTQPQEGVNALAEDIEGLLSRERWQEVEALYADDLRMMNWDDVKVLSAAGLTIGSHCHDHFLMHAAQNESEIRRQIAISRHLIEENTKKSCRHFVYPHGNFQNICGTAVKELESQGIKTALTTIPGCIESSSNLLLLRRLHVSAVPQRLFRALGPGEYTQQTETQRPRTHLAKDILIRVTNMADISLKNVKLYSTVKAADYYSQFDSLFDAEIILLNNIASFCASGDILDIGMGAGRTTPFLSQYGRSYLGIDYSSEMVAKCRFRFPELQFEQGDARNLEFLPANKFALVLFSYNGIDYVSHTDRITILSQIFRVITTGGYLIFSSHNRRYVSQTPFVSPVNGLRSLVSYIAGSIRYLKNLRLTYEAEDHALRVDGAFNYKLITYYIDAASQVDQVIRAGFEPISIINQNGQDISPNSADKSPWLYYCVRKS